MLCVVVLGKCSFRCTCTGWSGTRQGKLAALTGVRHDKPWHKAGWRCRGLQSGCPAWRRQSGYQSCSRWPLPGRSTCCGAVNEVWLAGSGFAGCYHSKVTTLDSQIRESLPRKLSPAQFSPLAVPTSATLFVVRPNAVAGDQTQIYTACASNCLSFINFAGYSHRLLDRQARAMPEGSSSWTPRLSSAAVLHPPSSVAPAQLSAHARSSD